MRVTVDVNVFVDVFTQRLPHYHDSAEVLRRIAAGEMEGVFPGHSISTVYYIVRKYSSLAEAEKSLDTILNGFEIGNLSRQDWQDARLLPMTDFEDAAISTAASLSGCNYIITRDLFDFAGSAIPAITPTEFLLSFPDSPSAPVVPIP